MLRGAVLFRGGWLGPGGSPCTQQNAGPQNLIPAAGMTSEPDDLEKALQENLSSRLPPKL
jgi:hypothetical protein